MTPYKTTDDTEDPDKVIGSTDEASTLAFDEARAVSQIKSALSAAHGNIIYKIESITRCLFLCQTAGLLTNIRFTQCLPMAKAFCMKVSCVTIGEVAA